MKKTPENLRYFTQKGLLRPLGIGLLVAGLVMIFFGFTTVTYYITIVITPLGLIMSIIGSVRHISDHDIQNQLTEAMRDYDKALTSAAGFDRQVLQQPTPLETAAYHFDHTAAYFKKGKNQTPVSDVYTRSHLFFTKEALLVASRTVSITALGTGLDNSRRDFVDNYPLSTIAGATVEEQKITVALTATKKPMKVTYCELVVVSNEGELFRLPVHNDMDVATFCDQINRRCGNQ